VDLTSFDQIGPVRLPSRFSRELSALAWDAPRRKQYLVALLSLPPVLFGASLLIAGVPIGTSAGPPTELHLEPEQFTLPMVALLNEMRKVAPVSLVPPGTTNINAVVGPIATPFLYQTAGNDRERASICLATAAWYEAGNDVAGQRAVIQVVLNRVRHPSFPKSVCGVVFQGSERRTGCQFSFTCDGSMSRRIPGPREWAQARGLADAALNGAVDPVVREATHFHADYVNPWWASKLVPISKVGAHIFYRWSGTRGSLGSGKAITGAESLPAVNPGVASVQPQPALVAAPRIDAGDVALAYPQGLSVEGKVQTPEFSSVAKQVEAAPKRPAGPTMMQVDASGPSGRWAISAMDRCNGSGPCRVVAFAQDDPAKLSPLFVFARDASGMQVALWNCEKAPRSRADQCLPKGAELAALLDSR
jgi:Cell Wall Hydrolase